MSHTFVEESLTELSTGWLFRAAEPAESTAGSFAVAEGWLPASVPGTVYQDLIALGRIPDPDFGLNEQQVQWVADADWCYRTDFEVQRAALATHADLLFEGLDTFARVWLNGELILESDNMFVPARVAVAGRLREGTNRLEIRFDSALRGGREREALFGKRHHWNGDSSRLYVRKAQYHYGWDWGPVMLTAGPWQPIRLQTYAVRIEELDSPVWLADDHSTARIDLKTCLGGDVSPDESVLEHALYDHAGNCVARLSVPATLRSEVSISLDRPQLWWPAGHGAQALYRLETRVLSGDRVLANSARRIGIRRVRLLQEPVAGEPGRSFYFEVNGKALFMGGANWIPDDKLLNNVSPTRYRERVQQAVSGNMQMLRVWAGGIYEDDAFYDACDELGVLVWQDFLFACGIYPAHAAFRASVAAEARAAVLRLRHHASLAIWCGNNEDYAIAEAIGLHGKGQDMARFDARAIYEQLLPEICAELDSSRPYWPGSPYSPSTSVTLNSNDQTVGDRHSWEVWHGEMRPYQKYYGVEARFVSEFGMQSHPSLAVLESVTHPEERFAGSRTMEAHNKAGSASFADGHRRLAAYMADTLNVGPALSDAVYATQFVQAEAMRYAYQDFRRRWQQAGARAVGGALVWQLNDCWPATSWAIIDSAGIVKPAWHAIRRALAPIALAVRIEAGRVAGWVMSDRSETQEITLEISLFNHAGDCVHEWSHALSVAANATTEFCFTLPAGLAAASQPLIAHAQAFAAGAEIARDTAWPEPFRFYRMPAAGIVLERDHAQAAITLTSAKPVKGLWLESEGLRFSDNFIDLLPDKVVTLRVEGDLDKAIVMSALDQPVQLL